MSQIVCTYNGDFHCEQVFACYLLKKLHLDDAKIIRTRDSSLIERSDYLIGLGLVYDHSKKAYDHHQNGFNHTLRSLDPSKSFNVRLTCAGLVYHHYGRLVIKKILNPSETSSWDNSDSIETLFDVIYENFVAEIDAFANNLFSASRFPCKINSDLTTRVSRLRPNWTDGPSDELHSKRFLNAIDLVGGEFEEIVKYYSKVWLPAKIFVKEALLNCKRIHSSGTIIDLSQSGEMPWIEHLITSEKELNSEGQIKFALFADVSGIWRLACVPKTRSLSELRIPFHCTWLGLSSQQFADLTGIPGCIYIHPLISDFETKEACLAVAEKLVQLNSEKHLILNRASSLSDGSFYSLTDHLSLDEMTSQVNGINNSVKDSSPDRVNHSSSLGAIMEEIPDDWNPMAEDHKSLANNYQYDPTDVGTILSGFKEKDLTGICKFYLRGYCKFGVGCVFKHMTQAELAALDSEEALIETFQDEFIREGMSLQVTVTCCLSPYSFYVVPDEDIRLPPISFGSRVGAHYDYLDPTQKNYLIQGKEMTTFYSAPENSENFMVYPAIGSLVAVKGEPVFYRGRVIDMSPDEDELLVMNIDSGIESMVDRREVFTLKPKFATLPAHAVHCALEVSSNLAITEQVMNNFSDQVLGHSFQANFKERDMQGRLRVDLYSDDGTRVTI